MVFEPHSAPLPSPLAPCYGSSAQGRYSQGLHLSWDPSLGLWFDPRRGRMLVLLGPQAHFAEVVLQIGTPRGPGLPLLIWPPTCGAEALLQAWQVRVLGPWLPTPQLTCRAEILRWDDKGFPHLPPPEPTCKARTSLWEKGLWPSSSAVVEGCCLVEKAGHKEENFHSSEFIWNKEWRTPCLRVLLKIPLIFVESSEGGWYLHDTSKVVEQPEA